MTYETIALWEIVIDAAGLALCLLSLAYVARCRNRGPIGTAPAKGGDFNAEMRLQILEQKAEAAILSLSRATARGGENVDVRGKSGLFSAPPDKGTAEEAAPAPCPTTDPYKAIVPLADSGLDTDAIYSRLKISKGEIRLALQMHELCCPAATDMRATA